MRACAGQSQLSEQISVLNLLHHLLESLDVVGNRFGLVLTNSRDAFVVWRLARGFSFGYMFHNLARIQTCGLEGWRLYCCFAFATRTVAACAL